MSNLSPPAARMVRAFNDCYEMPHDENWQALCVAATLRKLEDILARDRAEPLPPDLERAVITERIRLFRRITAIAAELEAS
jgi:hypothetical protein